MERCPPPSGRPFFQHVIIYIAKIMGLFHGSRVQMKVIYFIYYSHRDIELDCESNIDEFDPQKRHEFLKILVHWRKLLGFTIFFYIFIFYVFKERTVNCKKTLWWCRNS